MIPLTTKKEVQRITLLFTITYMVSYMTRINYGAIVSEMASAEKLSKSMLSLALTGSFITYGTGQIISGVCGDRFSPKKLVFGGLLVTMLMNLLIPFCQNPYQMLAVFRELYVLGNGRNGRPADAVFVGAVSKVDVHGDRPVGQIHPV